MNKRIKELSNKAVLTASATYANGPDEIWLKEYNKKFAELIVKEAGEYLMRPEFIGRSDLDWSMVLNEHFGVEE